MMDQVQNLQLVRRAETLDTLVEKCRSDMKARWSAIDFDGEVWPLHTLYQTRMRDVRFGPSMAAFAFADASYLLALRYLIGSAALDGKLKVAQQSVDSWRLLAPSKATTSPLATLRQHDLADIEVKLISCAKQEGAAKLSQKLGSLSDQIERLARLNVVDSLQWRPSTEAVATLRQLEVKHTQSSKAARASVIDRQIEAFSEVTSAMLQGDARLNAQDRSAIAFTNIMMCAPSRINELLAMQVGDHWTIEDFAKPPEIPGNAGLHRAHQLLLMKGSKGAEWSAKPVLNFMTKLTNECWNVLLKHSERSRELLRWYEQNPTRLFLTPELEPLRGHPLSLSSIWQIIKLKRLDGILTSQQRVLAYSTIWKSLTCPADGQKPTRVLQIDNPGSRKVLIGALPWEDVERHMLLQVHERMQRMRKVTPLIEYGGKLSEMLCLIDTDISPYLPQAWTDNKIRLRLKCQPSRTARGLDPSVFVKLGLRMTQDRKEVDCYLEPHDTRRWLTTQALDSKERISDALINKWANRLCVGSLKNYDLRTAEQRADQAAMPNLVELEDITKGLHELETMESRYGLSTEILASHGQGISVTSMEAMCGASDSRPVARTGHQIIILYANAFGGCLHPHHETPCRAYKCSSGCENQLTVKGHIPTNERWRKEAELSNRSIVNQLQNLITAHNRGVADDQEMFNAHLLTLVGKGLDAQAMTTALVEQFHEVKDQIRDPNFKRSLGEAFVALGVVKRLDDPEVASGALIKYHNPCRHAAPGHELAIEANFGSREEMARQSEIFYRQNPEMAPSRLGLRDQTYLLQGDDDSGDRDDKAA